MYPFIPAFHHEFVAILSIICRIRVNIKPVHLIDSCKLDINVDVNAGRFVGDKYIVLIENVISMPSAHA